MRERFSVGKQINFTESMTEKITAEADRLNVSFSDIVRECVENDLPRLRERYRKQFAKRKQHTKK